MVETKFQTSFIPKQPVTEESRRPHSGGGGILLLLGFLFLIISGAGAAGVFIWNKTILANIEQGRFQLEESKKGFDKSTIATYTKLDSRIGVAKELLGRHISASELFPKLGMNTLKTVRFNNFSYRYSGSGNVEVTMSGEGSDYESLVLQAQRFTSAEANGAFKSPIFTSFSKDKGKVVFTFTSGIDPYIVDYYQAKTRDSGTQPAAVVPAAQ